MCAFIIVNTLLGLLFLGVVGIHLWLRKKEEGNRKPGRDNWKSAITKCLIVPILILILILDVYVFRDSILSSSNDPKYMDCMYLAIIGLVFGWLGDVFLLNWSVDVAKQDLMNMGGLVSFLIGHIFALVYLGMSYGLGIEYLGLLAPFVLMPVVIWQVTKVKEIEFRIAIPVYASCLMLVLGMTLLSVAPHSNASVASSVLLIIGALFFLSSDGILGLKLFRNVKQMKTTHVMFTYAAAQLFLSVGIITLALL